MFFKSQKNAIKFLSIAAVAATTLAVRVNSNECLLAKEAKDEQKEKLISVQLICRHGARTPMHLIPGIEEAMYTPDMLEPFVKARVALITLGKTQVTDEISLYDKKNLKFKLKGGANGGMLTTVGEKQMFELGRRLRERYIRDLKFLPDKYDPDVIYTRASHFMRTIRTAKCVLAGLFTDPNDSKTEFIIHAHRNEDDWIFPNSLICPLFSHILKNQNKLIDTEEFILELEELHDHIGVKNNTHEKFLTYTAFRDDLICRQVHGKPIPDDLLKFMEKADLLAGMELAAVFEHNIKVASGLFVNLLLGNVEKAVHKDTKKTVEDVDQQKFIFYSAHDSTIGALLVALNRGNKEKSDYHWPPFGASIQIELWKDETADNSYFVRVFYLGEPLIISTCNSGYADKTKCDLKKFLRLLKRSATSKEEFHSICNQPIENYNFNAKDSYFY